MSPQQHEAVMQAEDRLALPNGGVPNMSRTREDVAEFYSVGTVAAKTSLSPWTIRREIAAGRLVAYKLHHEFRIRVDDYETWVSASRHTPVVWSAAPVEVASTTQDYRW